MIPHGYKENTAESQLIDVHTQFETLSDLQIGLLIFEKNSRLMRSVCTPTNLPISNKMSFSSVFLLFIKVILTFWWVLDCPNPQIFMLLFTSVYSHGTSVYHWRGWGERASNPLSWTYSNLLQSLVLSSRSYDYAKLLFIRTCIQGNH